MKRKFSTELRKSEDKLHFDVASKYIHRHRKFRTADKKIKTKVKWLNNLIVLISVITIEIIFIIFLIFCTYDIITKVYVKV